MTRIYVLFSVVGWAWAAVVLAVVLTKTRRDREGAMARRNREE
jgi:hypothetical protein